jgi:hypothetical protein
VHLLEDRSAVISREAFEQEFYLRKLAKHDAHVERGAAGTGGPLSFGE